MPACLICGEWAHSGLFCCNDCRDIAIYELSKKTSCPPKEKEKPQPRDWSSIAPVDGWQMAIKRRRALS